MKRVIPVLLIIAFAAGWQWFLDKRSDGRMWSPLWMAFNATATAALFLVAGIIGYNLSKHDRFVAQTAWSETLIWWEVGVGLVLLPLAAYLWHEGLQSVEHKTRRGFDRTPTHTGVRSQHFRHQSEH